MFKILKQELLFIPLMLILMEALRFLLFTYYPETAVFDRGSELETFALRIWQLTWVTSAVWILMRIVFPSAYVGLKSFYHEFTYFNKEKQHDLSLKIFFCFFFGLIFLMSGRANNETVLRKKLVDTLDSQLHIRELTGKNDGLMVEKYLNFVGRYKGDSWCAAFTSWNLNAIGVKSPPNPKSGWSPNFATPKYTVYSQKLVKEHKAQKVKPGDCFTLFYTSINRVGHVGFIIGETNDYFITIEGNTGLTGSRDGSGVHKYKRSKLKVYRVTNYITPYLINNEKITSNYIFIHSISNNKLLQPPCYKISKRNYRENTTCFNKKRFDILQGYNITCESGHFKDTSRCFYRQNGRCYVTRNNYNNTSLQKLGINTKRQISCNVLMQRFRIKGKAPNEYYTTALLGKLKKAGYTIYPGYKGNSVYT